VHGGTVQTVVLWNTRDLGYLTVYAAALSVVHDSSRGGGEGPADKLADESVQRVDERRPGRLGDLLRRLMYFLG
jgi:hypothetical protein